MILSVPFCPYHFVPYHFVLEPYIHVQETEFLRSNGSFAVDNVAGLIRSMQQEQVVAPSPCSSAGDAATPSAGPSSMSLQRQLDHLRSELNRARDENMRLHEKVVAVTMDSGLSDDGSSGLPVDETKLKSSLIRAQRDLVSCRIFLLLL